MKLDKITSLWFMSAVLCLGVAAFSHSAVAQTVYTADFSAPVVEWTDNTISTANGESFLATSSNGSGFGSNLLTLPGLPAHSYVTVNFDLYIIQSWDGNGPAGGGPDNWTLTSSTATPNIIFFSNFANYTGSNTQAYPEELPPYGSGTNYPPRTGQSDSNHLGYGTGDFGDATYSLSCTFAHSANDLDLVFTSQQNQAPGDEGWGLDNVVVSVSNVPPAPRSRPCSLASASSEPVPLLPPLALVVLAALTLLFAGRYLRQRI